MKRIVQRMSDGTSRFKDITHRQHLKQKGYSDKEIKEIEKKDIARGAAKPGDMDKPMKQPWKDAVSNPNIKKRMKQIYKEILILGQSANSLGEKDAVRALDQASSIIARAL